MEGDLFVCLFVKPNLDYGFSCMHLCMHENARADAQCKLSYCMGRKLFYDPWVSQNLDAPFRTCPKSGARMHAWFEDLLSPNDTNNNLANGKQWNWGESPGPHSTKWDKHIFIMVSKTLAQQKLANLYEAEELLGSTHHKDYHNKIKRQESHDMISKTTKLIEILSE